MVVSSTVSHKVQGVEKCNVRKESTGFPTIEWRKYQPATCTQCVLEQHAGQASVRASRRASTGKQDFNNRQAPGIQHLSWMRMKRKGLTETSAMG